MRVDLRGRVHAGQVQQKLPWLTSSTTGTFATSIKVRRTESVKTAADDRYGVVLNVQLGAVHAVRVPRGLQPAQRGALLQ